MTLSKTIYRQRTETELIDALQRLIDGLWGRKHQSHTLTIPVDELRDVDCILMDGINELVKLRAEVERLQMALAQEQREHANCEQFHHDGSMAKNTAMAALMDVCDAMAAEGDFDSASDETRRMVQSILNRRSQGGEM